MLKNYLTIAFRTLWKSKVYSFLNIIGLAVGLSAGILMLLWVQDELSFNSFHQNADRIYKLVAKFDVGGKKETWGTTPAPIATFGKKEIPEVADAVRIQTDWSARVFEVGERNFIEKKGAYADASLFNIFDFPLISGNPKNLFPNNRSIVLTQKVANKFFGDENPIGKIIRMDKKVIPLLASLPTFLRTPASSTTGLCLSAFWMNSTTANTSLMAWKAIGGIIIMIPTSCSKKIPLQIQ
jgi:putative ABC transport system permease protein